MVSKFKPYLWSVRAAYNIGLFPITLDSDSTFSLKYGSSIRIPFVQEFRFRLESIARGFYSINQLSALLYFLAILLGYLKGTYMDKLLVWIALFPILISLSTLIMTLYFDEELCCAYNSIVMLDKKIRKSNLLRENSLHTFNIYETLIEA